MLTKLIVKSGLVGGCVYYSVDQGVWGNSVTTTNLYGEISKQLEPYKEKVKKTIDMPPLPSSGEVGYITAHYWNRGVKATFGFLIELPSLTTSAIKSGVDYTKNHPEVKKLLGNEVVKSE